MINRDQIIKSLIHALEPQPGCLAMWEAGSAAFGRLDEYSDIDLVLDVDRKHLEAVIELFEATLKNISPITDYYELPPPTWHGHVQRFYRLEDTSPYLILDVVFIEHENPQKFLEPELHGRPLIYFDKAGVVKFPNFDWPTHNHLLRQQLTNAVGFMKLVSNLPEKELQRGRPLDALYFYNGLIMRPLVTLLRATYDPARYNFGPRYLAFDLPEEEVDRLTPLIFIADSADLEKKLPVALAWFWELAAELEVRFTPE